MGSQFVVQLENRPGALARLARAFADGGVSFREVSGGGTGDFAYAVVTATDDAAARNVLRTSGYVFVEGDALIVDVVDRPGGLADVTEQLADAGVNIFTVLFLGRKEGAVVTAFTVDNVDVARKALGRP